MTRPRLWLSVSLLAALIVVSLLAACSAAPQASPTQAPAAQAGKAAPPQGVATAAPAAQSSGAAAAAGGELRVSMYDSSHYQELNKIVNRFTDKTGIKVVFEVSPQGEAFYKKQASFLMTGQATPDIVFFNDGMIPEYAGSNFLVPLDDMMKDPKLADPDYDWADFLPAVQSATSFAVKPGDPKKIYGLPTEVSTLYLFYRTDLIKEPPKTWDQYIEVAKNFTQSINSGSPTKYGTTIQGKSNSNYKEWFMWLWSYGGDVFDKELKPTLNSPQAVKALQDDFDLLLKWKAVPPDSTKFLHPDVTNAVKTGTVAMAPKWNSGYKDLFDPVKSPVVGGKLGVAMMPGVKQPDGSILSTPFVQQWMFGINAASKQKELAFKFLQYWTGKEGLKAWGPETGGVTPGRKSILLNPEFAKNNVTYPLHAESLKTGKSSPSLMKEWTQIGDTALGPELEQALAGTKGYQQALDAANEQATSVLKKAGYLK